MSKLQGLYPDIDFSLLKITTSGDRERNVPLTQMAGDGVFVKELEEALVDGRIDLAVHSLKDMPTEISKDLYLAAVDARLDPRDVLVSQGEKLNEMAAGSRIGTGSLRRMAQLYSFREGLKVEAIRGNIDTRLNKVSSKECEGIILAAAALIRLELAERITEYLPTDHFLPAVGQGALGIEVRSGDERIIKLISAINHRPTWCSVIAERAFLLATGGGCRAPIAALGSVQGDTLMLKGMVGDPGGRTIIRDSQEGSTSEPEQVGIRLAKKMLKTGAAEILAEARSQ